MIFVAIQNNSKVYWPVQYYVGNMLMWRHFTSDNKSERLRGESVKSRYMYCPQDSKE